MAASSSSEPHVPPSPPREEPTPEEVEGATLLLRRFPELQPIRRAPGLYTLNGFGTMLYGNRDPDPETGTYVRTYCLTALFMPVFALAAYRLADAEQGWYFLGRVPLSGFARGWNVMVLAALLLGGGGLVASWAWESHISRPGYHAEQLLEEAAELEQRGSIMAAAHKYAEVAHGSSPHVERGRTALEALVRRLEPAWRIPVAPVEGAAAGTASPGAEPAGLRQAAALLGILAGLPDPPATAATPPLELWTLADSLATHAAVRDPVGALAVLDAVAGRAPDPAAWSVRREALLQRILELDPRNPEAATELALILEGRQDREGCDRLLTPLAAQLGQSEGARILGQLRVAQGQIEQAYTLLQPYVQIRLEKLHRAETAFQEHQEAVVQAELRRLEQGEGPSLLFSRYKAARSEDAKQEVVNQHLRELLQQDARSRQLEDDLVRAAAVVPSALDLGIIMLQHARAQPDAERRRLLEDAERVFLAIRGVAGGSETYQLHLAQVYYWLGKQQEGRELFDGVLTKNARSVAMLLAVGHLLREVGAESESRVLAEEAYSKTQDPREQSAAARLRAVLQQNNDDEILWLERCPRTEPTVEASLASAYAQRAVEQNQLERAARHLRQAVEVYEQKLPVSTSTLNNRALVHFQLATLEGSREQHRFGVELLDRALAQDPSNSVLLFNVASAQLDGVALELLGLQLDLRALPQEAYLELLPFLYRDEAGRAPLAEALRKSPQVAAAIRHLERMTTLAPGSERGHSLLVNIHQIRDDLPALRQHRDRLQTVQLDLADLQEQHRKSLKGERDVQRREQLQHRLQRLKAVSRGPHQARRDLTWAIAVDRVLTTQLALAVLGEPVDWEALVRQAEAWHQAQPSGASRRMLRTLLLQQAAVRVAQSTPDWARLLEANRRQLTATHLIPLVLEQPGPVREALLAQPELTRALALEREEVAAFREHAQPLDWALLHLLDPTAGDELAAQLRAQERVRLINELELRLNPVQAAHHLDAYWLDQLAGQPEQAQRRLGELERLGVVVRL